MNQKEAEKTRDFWMVFAKWAKERGMNPTEYMGDVNKMMGVFPSFMAWKHEQQRVHPGTN